MLRKIYIIASYTFAEILKSKVFYVTIAVGLIAMLMTYIATEFTYGVPEKVALDFGLGMLSISSLGISVFMGVTLLPKEIDSRTVYMVISRPVPRWVFITGKILGLIAILCVNLIILSIMTLGTSSLLGGNLETMTFIAIGFNLLESILLLFVVVFFSLFSNVTISAVVSILVLMSGHAIKATQGTMFVENRGYLKSILELYHLFLPAFYKLNFKDYVLYNQNVSLTYIVQSLTYGVCYIMFLFFAIIHIFNKKNLD